MNPTWHQPMACANESAGIAFGQLSTIYPTPSRAAEYDVFSFRCKTQRRRYQEPLEIVVVAGRNESARNQLAEVEPPNRHRVKVVGFTHEMDELMAVADLVVSKPGGLTTSEALARGAAMAVVNPIPGQECRNSDFLLENGAAVKINNIVTMQQKLTPLLRDSSRLVKLRENARRIGKPQAAFDVARRALTWPTES